MNEPSDLKSEKGKLLTIAEAARRLNIRPVTLYQWIQRGTITVIRFSPKTVRIDPRDLDELIDRRKKYRKIIKWPKRSREPHAGEG